MRDVFLAPLSSAKKWALYTSPNSNSICVCVGSLKKNMKRNREEDSDRLFLAVVWLKAGLVSWIPILMATITGC